LVDFLDGASDFCEEDCHVFDLLDEDVLVGAFLVGVQFAFDVVDGED
jgi:hypothetical protein